MVDAEERGENFPKLSRFEIVRRIGEGGMGVVYEARDRWHGTRVALKTLHRFDAETLLLLKQEFRALEDIQHPNLVGLRELAREGDTWFFTMELVDGVDLVTYVLGPRARASDRTGEITLPALSSTSKDAQASGARPKVFVARPFAADTLRAAFAQLAQALSALHAAGKVHRDIKPSNVLVTREGRVVLLDFGLIVDVTAPRADSAIVGTARYMAPEQALNEEVGPPADWYSFGVVLYECLTGRPPFDGSGDRVLERKLLEDPPPPSLVAPEVPPELDELCARLLRREPSGRPTGAEVVGALGGLRDRSAVAPERPPAPRPTPFVGRGVEMRNLDAAFHRVLAGETIAVVVEGESGVGKSALARTFARDLEDAHPEVLVLMGRCYEREVVPYKALDGVMDSLSRHLARQGDAQVTAVFPTDAPLLAQVFPVLRRLARFDIAARQRRSRPDLVAHESRARLFDAVRELFEKLAAAHTLVVLIDDLHWADADSLALLAEILSPPSPPRMLLIATTRARSDGRSSRASSSFGLPGRVVHLPLGPLATDEALTLAHALLAETGSDSAHVAESIAAEAEGHPLFVDELVRHALELGGHATQRLHLDEALAARVLRLDARDRALIEVLAVAGVSLKRRIAMAAAGLDFDAFARSDATLRVAHLARAGGARGDETIETYHDRVREAVFAGLDAERRAQCHRRLAVALEADVAHDPDLVATHWIEAGEPSRAAVYACEAADNAFEALAYNHAATLYDRAIGLMDDDAERQRMRVRLGESLASAGRGGDAARAFVAASAAAKGEPALDLRRRAAEELLLAGNVDSGLAAIRGIIAQLGMRMPGPVLCVVLLVFFRAVLALRGLGYKLRPSDEVSQKLLLRIDACCSIARALSYVDPLLSACFQARMLLLALRAGEAYRVSYALALEAMWLASKGVKTHARASAILALSAEAARHTDAEHLGALLVAARGFVAFVHGRLPEALAESDRAAAMIGQQGGVFWEQRSMQLTSLWSLSAMGELAALAARVDPALREAEARGDVTASTAYRTGSMNQLWLRRGDAAGARAAAEGALRDWTQGGYHNQHWWAAVALAQVDLYEGKGRDAWERVSRDWSRARRALVFVAEIVHFDARHVRARAAILAASQASGGERESMLRLAARDVRWLERKGPAYGAPWCFHLAACIAAVRGERGAAATALAQALPGFDATPAPIWAASARWQLARLVDGEEGKTVGNQARAWMDAQGIADPDRMAALFAPGFEGLRGRS